MEYYNEISEGYEELHGEEQKKKIRLIMEKISVKEDELLLDVGCGTGLTTKFWKCKKIGIDPAIKLLQKAEGADFVNAEAEHIPFRKNSFDWVISITAIQNFHDIRKGLEEIKRVGKNKFVLSFLKKSQKRKMIEKLIKEIFNVKEEIEEEKDIIFLI